MKLYDFKGSFSSRRIRILLAEKGIEVPREQVNVMTGENREKTFLQINPDATVPVLELDDGSYLTEAHAINRYFETLQPEPALMGQTPQEQAEVEMWQRKVEQWITLPCQAYFHHATPGLGDKGRYRNKAWGEKNHENLLYGMERLNKQLEMNRYIAGANFSVADITALASLDFGMALEISIPESCHHLQRWYDDVSQRPSAAA